ncbi:HPr family phosphocarrier protein [Lacipirellula limnantheis]|uniref:Phosphocarrier protein HPr n=1 Tax=Lacipirellula limnantheis TaxID=2528024 RepID=A0A517U613_9BACT|nr:HPr family phosphocarrier protein [Lacipirellula limnantheis]QDT76075.1 Phosphocarrier protein HPr [Lacipirellula limnantheis]
MSSPAAQRVVVISDKDPLGLHIRPAEQFVRLAMKFPCEIEVVRESVRADGKSIMHMLTLGAEPGAQLRLEARGEEAEQALDALARFIENGFVLDQTEGQPPADAGGG